MLTLDVTVHIPDYVLFTSVGEDAILLNTQTNQYFTLEEVGARLWSLLKDGRQLRESYRTLLAEYEVTPAQLEQDLLELLNHLMENGIVEIVQE